MSSKDAEYREWLKANLEAQGHGSKKRLAEHLGVAQDAITRMLNVSTGKESRQIKADELLGMIEFFGNEPKSFRRPALVQSFDPDAQEAQPDDRMTIGTETGAQGIPEGTIPQIDVTAGMGAGGVPIVSEGVIGKSGMTFAAEAVADYWRLPAAFLAGLAAKVGDLVFLPVRGDSMFPTLHDGEVVAADTRHRLPSPDGIYALGDEFGGIVVKRLQVVSRPGDDEIMVDVISDNPHHKTKTWRLEDLRIIGMVVIRVGRI